MSRYLILVALRWLPVGMMIPVSVLLPLERGLSLAQLGPIGPASALTVPVIAAIVLHLASMTGLVLLMKEQRAASGVRAWTASVPGVPAAIGGALRVVRGSRAVAALLVIEFL